MLNKDYSTASILLAANVLDGGKDFSKVPEAYRADVAELMNSQTNTPVAVTVENKKEA